MRKSIVAKLSPCPSSTQPGLFSLSFVSSRTNNFLSSSSQHNHSIIAMNISIAYCTIIAFILSIHLVRQPCLHCAVKYQDCVYFQYVFSTGSHRQQLVLQMIKWAPHFSFVILLIFCIFVISKT